MTSAIQSLIDGYNDILTNQRDPRVDGWLFMSGPLPTLCICLSYVYVVKVLGPYLMRNQEPLNIRRLLVYYNFAQVVFSAWLFYELLMSGWLYTYSIRCQPIDYSNDPLAVRMVHACWWYYFSKFTEFFDTLFFVLRKKYEHISLLHVIHHGVMPMSVWFGVKFTPGGHSTFFGLLNTFVHIIMYFYYMLAAMGPRYHKFLWWKKYLTTLQMIQFVGIMTHTFQLMFIECDYPRGFVIWIGGHAVMFLILFSNFYNKAYYSKKAIKASHANGTLVNGNSKTNGVNHAGKNGYTNGHLQSGNGHVKQLDSHVSNGHSNGHTLKNGDTYKMD